MAGRDSREPAIEAIVVGDAHQIPEHRPAQLEQIQENCIRRVCQTCELEGCQPYSFIMEGDFGARMVVTNAPNQKALAFLEEKTADNAGLAPVK